MQVLPWNRPSKRAIVLSFRWEYDRHYHLQAVDSCQSFFPWNGNSEFLRFCWIILWKTRSTSIPFVYCNTKQFFDQCKSSLNPGELVVCADFSDNYAFVLQDAAQGFHWNKAQSTLHPFVAYFRESHTSEINHLNFVVISECLHHDTVAVHLFQKRLIWKTDWALFQWRLFTFQTARHPSIKTGRILSTSAITKLTLVSKLNGTFLHGKGACDGLGGTVKRLATKASLQRPFEDQIMTPLQLYRWASKNIPGINCTLEEYESDKTLLKTRFDNSRTIAGTRRLHCFIPNSRDSLQTKRYSTSSTSKLERVTKLATDLELEQVTGYVTCKHQDHWWLAQVLAKDSDNGELLNLLHPYGPSRSFKHPPSPNVITLALVDVQTIVEPRTTTGRIYTLRDRARQLQICTQSVTTFSTCLSLFVAFLIFVVCLQVIILQNQHKSLRGYMQFVQLLRLNPQSAQYQILTS